MKLKMEIDSLKQLMEPSVLPGPAEQREIITALEKEPEAVHAYFVSSSWYKTWKSFVGLSKSKQTAKENRKAFRVPKEERGSTEQEVEKSPDRKSCDLSENKDGGGHVVPSSREKRRRKHKSNSQDLSGELPELERVENKPQHEGNRNSKMAACFNDQSCDPVLPSPDGTNPGPVAMDTQDSEHNILIDEKIWMKWVEWYSLAESHQLDRRNWSSQEKYFEVCLLSPYSSIVENPLKVLDVTETVAYVEVQLRKMYKVPLHKKTRQWVCEKARHARFKLILDRTSQVMNARNINFNMDKDYIIALEVSSPQGTWPTSVPGDPESDLTDLLTLTQGHLPPDYWFQELTQTVDSVFCGISSEMKETADGIVQTAKCVSDLRENDLLKVKCDLDTKAHEAVELEKYLDDKSAELVLEERNLKQAVAVVKQERQFLDEEKVKFQSEVQQMEKLNKITESKVKLDVGGHVYTTSVLTLTRDPESMLAAMFSGRHSLVREEDGSYFLDRDGTHFRYILNFLRDGGFRDGTLPPDRGTLMELLTEAEYYQISGLVACLQEQLATVSVSVSKSFTEERPDSSGDEDGGSGASKKPLRRVVYRREITTAT